MIAFLILLYCLVNLYATAITENNIPCLFLSLLIVFYMIVIRPQKKYHENIDKGGTE